MSVKTSYKRADLKVRKKAQSLKSLVLEILRDPARVLVRRASAGAQLAVRQRDCVQDPLRSTRLGERALRLYGVDDLAGPLGRYERLDIVDARQFTAFHRFQNAQHYHHLLFWQLMHPFYQVVHVNVELLQATH